VCPKSSKKAATLVYLGMVLFRSEQMITEKKIRTVAGPRWDRIRVLLDDRDPFIDVLTSCLPSPQASIAPLPTTAL
jgi:hypothetical protein